MKTLRFLPLALTCALLVTSNTAFAQRERASRDERRQQRAQENANLSPEQRQQNFQARMQERLKSMNPEQRAAFQERMSQIQQKMKDAGLDMSDPSSWRKARDLGVFDGMGRGGDANGQNGRGNRGGGAAAEAMRQMMEAAGITNFDIQDAIIAYVTEQNQARATLFQLAQTAAGALQVPTVVNVNTGEEPDVEAADAKVAETFSAYETAVKAENARQDLALQVLDAKINYSGTPRIKAFLSLVGILNNDVLAIGGPAAVFTAPQDGSMMQTSMDGNAEGQGNWNGGQGRGGRGDRGNREMQGDNGNP